MRKRSPSSGLASVFTLTTRALPARCCAAVSTSGAIMRHGPHHGAQKSTTTGIDDVEIAASNEDVSGTSIGAAGCGSGVWHLAQREDRPSVLMAKAVGRPAGRARASERLGVELHVGGPQSIIHTARPPRRMAALRISHP